MTLDTLTDKERVELLREIAAKLEMSYDYSSTEELLAKLATEVNQAWMYRDLR